MAKLELQNFSLFLLVSIGVMITMTFGFVPTFNLLMRYNIDITLMNFNFIDVLYALSGCNIDVMYAWLFWTPFGISALICGYLIDKIKNKKSLCFSYVIWGTLVIGLNFTKNMVQETLVILTLIAIFTGPTVVVGASYLSSHTEINRRGLIAGIFLGTGWGLVSITSVISALDMYLNLIILGTMNIIVGLVSFFLANAKKIDFDWEKIISIPRDFDVKKNGRIYWASSLIFGMFLGVIVFLLGANTRYYETTHCFYLKNLKFYIWFASTFKLGLINLDFLVIGALNFVLSPLFGKLMDKIGRKPIFLLTNILIPLVLTFFTFWEALEFMFITVVFYATITANYVVIICTVWSDLSPKNKIARYNGYGWSSVALGGAFGFLIANFMTLPGLISYIDTMAFIVIMFLSEASLIPFVFMKESLPPAEEMEWNKEIIHIYVINEGGIVLVDYPFQKSEQLSADLFSGGISGLQTLLQEMTQSQQKLKIIDHEDKKILFEYGVNFMVALLASKDLGILRTKLRHLTEEIQNVFWETIATWDGSIEVFNPINTMIRNYFTV